MTIHRIEDAEDIPEGKNREFQNAKAFIAVINAVADTEWRTVQQVQEVLQSGGIERDIRWVQQVLKYLTEVDLSLEREASTKPYRYRKQAGVDALAHDVKKASQALTLLLAREHLKPLLPATVLKWMDDSFIHAERALAPDGRARPYNTWLDKVAVVTQLPQMVPPKLDEAVLAEVGSALLNDRWLNVDYRNVSGRILHNRRVMPLALVRQAERLFLACRFDGYQDVRNLALHRILSATATPHSFTRPADFVLEDYINAGGFGFGHGERIELVIRVAAHLADLLAETPLSPDQFLAEDPAGGFRVTATVVKGEQIRWWLRMQGRAVHEVISPAGLLINI